MLEKPENYLNTTDQFFSVGLFDRAISAIADDYPEMTKSLWFGVGRPKEGEKQDGYLQLHVYVSKVERTDSYGREVISALAENSHISRLGFSHYQLSDNAMLQLKEVLAKNTSLTSITFNCVDITPEGIARLAEALENSPHLTEIHFIETLLSDESAKKIANALKKNQSLKAISFKQSIDNGPRIGEGGALALLEGLKENYNIVEFNFEHISDLVEGTVNTEKKKFLKRNQDCAELCSDLDKKFVSLNRSFENLEYFRTSKQKDGLDLTKDVIGNYLYEASEIISELKAKGYPVAEWQRKVDRAQSKVNILSHEEIDVPHLLDAYVQHFSDGADKAMNYKLARALFYFDKEDFESLYLDAQLANQWLLRLLKGDDSEEAERICKFAYKALHGKHVAEREWSHSHREVVLTVAQLESLKKVLIDSKDEVFETLKKGRRVDESEILALDTEEKKFAAEVLNRLNNGIQIAIYEEWILRKKGWAEKYLPIAIYNELMSREKGGEEKYLPSLIETRYRGNYNQWFKAFKLQIEEAKQQEKAWETSFFAKFRKSKISRDIISQGWNSAYKDVLSNTMGSMGFFDPSINTQHSRSLSAHRLAKVSTDSSPYAYEEIVRILQIEYHALPDQDKAGAFHYTFWRYRTLEHWLEKVFEKNNITPVRSEDLSQAEKLASFLLSWIGDQERSFAYKVLENTDLIKTVTNVGDIAHRTIFSTENDFETLKSNVINELQGLGDNKGVGMDTLVSEIRQKFPDSPQNRPK